MTEQPEALRLADALEYASNNLRSVNHQAAAELRRQHERIRELELGLEIVGKLLKEVVK